MADKTERYKDEQVCFQFFLNIPVRYLEEVHLKIFIALLMICFEKVENDIDQLA